VKPLVVFPDPIVVGLRVLRGDFLSLPEVAATGATVSHKMPARDADTVEPSILVANDGDAGTGHWPVSEDALLRVTVWDRDPVRASWLARTARAHLLADPGAADSRGFTRGSTPLPATDPDDGTPLSSFTIIARLRPE
jgi:hypothetical protein